MQEISMSLRMKEILEDKNITFKELEKLVGNRWSDSTLQRMASGKRVIYNTDLVYLSKALGLQFDRFTRSDVRNIEEELDNLLNHENKSLKTIRFAKRMVRVSIGITEQVSSLNRLARAYRIWGGYAEARETWEMAVKILEGKVGYEKLHNQMIYNIVFTYYDTGETYKLLNSIDELKEKLDCQKKENQEALARLKQLKAHGLMRVGEVVTAKQLFEEALAVYSEEGDPVRIGRVLHSIFETNFRLGRFDEAKRVLQKSRELLLPNDIESVRAISDKDYIKVLILTEGFEEAHELIDRAICRLRNKPTLEDTLAKILLIKARYYGDIGAAEEIIELSNKSTVNILVLSSASSYLLKQKSKSDNMAPYLDIMEQNYENFLLGEWL